VARHIVGVDYNLLSEVLVSTTEETKTTWRTRVVLRACREFLARDKMFKEKYQSHLDIKTIAKEDSAQLQTDEDIFDDKTREVFKNWRIYNLGEVYQGNRET
jgi:hypothetical protein